MTDLIAGLVVASERYLRGLDHPGSAEVAAGLDRRRRAGDVAPAATPITDAHLAPALAAVEGQPDLVAAIASAAPGLAWRSYDKYPAEAIGAGFLAGNAYAPLVSPDAPFFAGDYELGLFLIAPGVFYRDHRHAAPELYAPLTGPHGWRFAPGAALVWLPAHVPVWNSPLRPHATKVGTLPFLCLYVWTEAVVESATIVPAEDWTSLDG